MTERKPLSKKIRFEVFKRDSFTCQYCGRMSPDVILEVDHINPIFDGGNDNILNLVTSCFDCNRGKGKRKLSDSDEIKKQQEQLKLLSQKREQLAMMLKWRVGLEKFNNIEILEFEKIYKLKTGFVLTEFGRNLVKKWIKEFGFLEVIESMELSISQYFTSDTESSINKTFDYIPKICNVRKRQNDNPVLQQNDHVKAILKKRVSWFNSDLYDNMLIGFRFEDFEKLKTIARKSYTWDDFVEMFENEFGGY